ncbi:MAG: DUF58 domain-containing protein [Chloroherpetonaceae bacterium]
MPYSITPNTLAKLKGLNLIAKTVVDGFLLGLHQSKRIGIGLEFSEYRAYQLGDDVRTIDWKLVARSDKFFVRNAEVETSVAIRILLDASASMCHEEDGITKFDYARWLAASLSYLAYQQGDAVGLYVIQDSISHMPAQRDKTQLQRIFNTLQTVVPKGKWIDSSQIQKLLSRSKLRELTLFISDMNEHTDEIISTLNAYSRLKNDVVLFHLMGANERDFNYTGDIEFEDLETGEIVKVNAETAKAHYQTEMHNRLKTLEKSMQAERIAYQRFIIQEPLDDALRKFLTMRKRLPR